METVRSADGTTIAYERVGAGPPLVVVPGTLCDRTAFAPLAAQLAGTFTVHLYDRRGRGDSGDTPPYAPDREVDDLAAVVAAAGGSATVFGHSSGAALALLAAARGVPATGVVAYEPPYDVDPLPPDARLAHRVEELVAAGRADDAVRLFFEQSGTPPDVLAAREAEPWWPVTVAMGHTLPYDFAIVGEDGLPRELFARITAPTLVVVGEGSPQWFRDTAAAIVDAVPGARLAVLPGQDHNAAPDVLAAVLTELLANPWKPARAPGWRPVDARAGHDRR